MTPVRSLIRLCSLLLLPIAVVRSQDVVPLRGIVIDSLHHGPLVGAKVVAARAALTDAPGAQHEFAGFTDSNGRFEIPALAPAVYLVTVEHPWLDSAGFEVPAQTVDLRDKRSGSVALGVPSGATIRAAFCKSTSRDSTLGMVEGFVRDATSGQPVGAVRIVFDWTDFSVDLRTGRSLPKHHALAASTARDGSYTVCGIPVAQSFLMQGQIGERAATGAIEASIPAGGVLLENMRIAAGTPGMAPVGGAVRRMPGQQPMAGAHVHVFGVTTQTVTASDGSFFLPEVPIGTQSVEVTAVGMKPLRYAVDIAPGGSRNLQLAMNAMGQVLDTVRSIAKRPGAAALRDEFDARASRGAGQYITEDMIAQRHPWQTSDLIRYVAGFTFRNDTVYTTRGTLELGGSNSCKPVLLIDGNRADSMNEVLPLSIHGIEIYSSNTGVPLKYASSAVLSDCGAILIWTK